LNQYGLRQRFESPAYGLSLLQYPDLVKSILNAVVKAVDVPVTPRLAGWAPEQRNCVEIAQWLKTVA
jgi:tRNA-dihydrouridine synthase